MVAELSLPVLWVEDDGPPLAGRIDLYGDRLHLDGGSRADRRTRDVAYAEISSLRIGRNGHDRIAGRRAVVLALCDGRTISFVDFDRQGDALDVAHRLEARIQRVDVTVGRRCGCVQTTLDATLTQ
jgi:hypothetical protein